jgi:ferredoxin
LACFFFDAMCLLFISVPALARLAAQSKRTPFVDCAPYYKDAMLGRFYAICNCCPCCCGAMRAHQRGTPMLASSGYVADVDAELCASGGLCAVHCQFGAISLDEGYASVDVAACMGCGVCVAHCSEDAIELIRELAKGEPLEIQKLVARSARTARSSESGSLLATPGA